MRAARVVPGIVSMRLLFATISFTPLLLAPLLFETTASAQWSVLPESALRLGRECAAGNDESCKAVIADKDGPEQAYFLATEGSRALILRLATFTVDHRDAITVAHRGRSFSRDATLHYELAKRILNSGLSRAPTDREARGPLLRAVELKPDFAEALETLGGIELGLGRPEAALGHLRAAVRANPRLIGARMDLGLGLLLLRRPREAADEYRVVLGLAEAEASHRNWATAKLGDVQFWLGDGDAALKLLREPVAGRIVAGSDVTCTTAITLWWLGRDDEARHECKLAVEGPLYCNCQGRISADAVRSAPTSADDAVMRAALSNNADLRARADEEIVVEGTTAFSDVQIHPVTGLRHRFTSRAHQYDDESRVIEAVDDLLARSRVPITVDLHAPRVMTLSRREMRRFVSGRTSFYDRFSKARGFVTVSRPGFSQDGRVAAIAVQQNNDLWNGPLFLFVLDRQGEGWTLRTGADTGARN